MSSFGAIPVDLAARAYRFSDLLGEQVHRRSSGIRLRAGAAAARSIRPRAGRARSASICTRSGPGSNATASSASRRRRTCCWHSVRRYANWMKRAGSRHAPRAIRRNHETLMRGMRELGFEAVPRAGGSELYHHVFPLSERSGLPVRGILYAAERVGIRDLSRETEPRACFRIGTIGRLSAEDVENLLHAIQRTMVRPVTSAERSI